MSRFESFSFLAFNFCASVAVIFVNKLIFVSFRFNFTTLLTAIHYIMTLLGLELLAACRCTREGLAYHAASAAPLCCRRHCAR